MGLQLWTIVYIPPAAVVFIVLLRVLRIRVTDARRSRNYYALTLVFVLAWMVLSIVMQNVPQDRAMEADLLSKFSSVVTSLAVLCFVVTTIYFRRPPNLGEGVLVSLPLLVVLVAILFDSFEIKYMSYWWLGQISDPALGYGSTILTVGVILYGLSRLILVRSKVVSADVRRRLGFLVTSLSAALVSSLVLYVGTQALGLPPLETLSTGLSILISYPAFSPRGIRAQRSS